ncbi:hypothetical protein [Streptomyces sp. SBT349]|uniref:hypothetical protein n=1 Tax=Streptomyces sp. SBT349 TaxID=1580539 RepID=UPI000AFD281A|nr:hypothetical protein [Streptomyces sp. SBT349]
MGASTQVQPEQERSAYLELRIGGLQLRAPRPGLAAVIGVTIALLTAITNYLS